MGLTLIEAATGCEQQPETRLAHLAVIKTFAEGELLSWLPFMNIAGGGLFYSVEKELPSVGFRAVNEGYRQSYGVVDPQSEAVHLRNQLLQHRQQPGPVLRQLGIEVLDVVGSTDHQASVGLDFSR